ncbi:MAG: LytTR family DNA-binding domain-containing protein [Cyclobacteriaceae bacterium]|nr:response regulator transcription factor [Cyclobacteriaceae bacterium]MCB9238608.1 response regulator transcription factor [Flammeovirgaceae bacterium]MCB0499800.1 response regulator transcription factor [Cyclobacteriaceae bacterium]MCO5271780.1 LytTR family DNA-binding domain-containing protein [Cyclobacteriaceae bacterium]MCW5902343.1 response regulator transcription factor [Cyclobacteriaceae bacterium]
MLKGIIVDDEFKSRESLRILLEEFCEGVEVCALCQNVDEGLEAIKKYKPEIVFLDIQMQRESGFDLLTRIKNIGFEVIFTTAHSEYAIKAFKFSAIDYLLKPIDIAELKRAIGKVDKKMNGDISTRLQHLIQNLQPAQGNHKLALPTLDGLVFVKVSDIIYCEASSNYTEIIVQDGKKYVVSRTLKEYEDLLTGHNFYRIHNSYLINLNAIKKYIRGEGGYVVMNNDQSLTVSKRKKDGFLEKIGTRG